jgi:hypothetical protein
MNATDAPTRTGNPYVGPRAFRAGEELPARDRETRELANLLKAERIVLLHAPSGAGKTSLIQAALDKRLRRGRFRPSHALRVNLPPPSEMDVVNRYTFSVGLSLLDGTVSQEELAALTLKEIVETAKSALEREFFVLVIDQFEEILLIDPADREQQNGFFAQLGEALEDGTVWALLSMREDYMGGLDRFLRYVPGQLSVRYRLDFLDRDAAKAAIRGPAEANGTPLDEDAADELVARLATATKQIPGGEEVEVPAPYVQPVQLQVVSKQLWRSVSRERRAEQKPFDGIHLPDVERHADISIALQSYYAGVVEHAAEKTGADIAAIRRWFENELITPQLYRSQTLRLPDSGDADPAAVIKELEDGYLIRGDTRGASTWYEIAHDKLVRPILEGNDLYFRRYREPWRLTAREWQRHEDDELLLAGLSLRNADKDADRSDTSAAERRFLDASHRAERASTNVVQRTQQRVSRSELFAYAEFVVIVVLIMLLLLLTLE